MKPSKTMKVMKTMKVAKVMRRKKAMKAMKVGRRWLVLAGKRVKTSGGLKKEDLMKNKRGKVVSKKSHAQGKKAFAAIKKWTTAVAKAKAALHITGFVAVGGKSPQGKALYAK